MVLHSFRCTIPPVNSINSSSVTLIIILLLSVLLFLYIFSIFISYSFLTPFSIFNNIFASPVFISSLVATSISLLVSIFNSDVLFIFPYIPKLVFISTLPIDFPINYTSFNFSWYTFFSFYN